MSNNPTHTNAKARALVSEDAVRGALRRRPRARPDNPAAAPVAGATKLRRWSVAELIARAAPRPPANGVAH